MKKIFLVILLFFINFLVSNADSGTSNVSWSENSGKTECGTSSSHGVEHQGVPNGFGKVAKSGSISCTTHTYSKNTYTKAVSGEFTACNPGDRVTGGGDSYITCEKYDDTPPSISDITDSYNNGNLGVNSNVPSFLRAGTHGMTFTMKTNDTNNSAEINKVIAEVENDDYPNSFESRSKSDLNGNTFSESFEFKKVDKDRNGNNYREYTYKIKDICDKAGNCLSHKGTGEKIFNYNVYANYIDINNSFKSSPSFPVVADGKEKKFTFTLKDMFGNNVIPVKSNSGEEIRSLNFSLNYNNDLYANQYERNGVSGIKSSNFYFGNTEPFIDLSMKDNSLIRNISDVNANHGNYKIGFKPYSPTYYSLANDGRQYADGSFRINSILVNLSDGGGSKNLGNNIDFQVKPKIVTEIKGSLVKNNLVVGTKQDSKINLKNNSTDAFDNGDILLEYGYIDISNTPKQQKHNNLELNYLKNGVWNNIVSGKQSNVNNLTKTGLKIIGDNNFYTLLRQKGKLSELENKTYITTHVKDFIDGKNIVYSSHSLGLKNYSKSVIENKNNTFQRKIKISGNAHSLHYTDSVANNGNNLKTIGNLDKSELQKFIRKKVSNDLINLKFSNPQKTGNSTLNLMSFTSSGGRKIGETLYFYKNNGENIEISGNYTGIKNIVIYGGNAYITGDIKAHNTKNDILSIISIENNGKGGNIYVKPTVENIHAVMYADKALLSYDGRNELSPKNGGTYEKLKNRLYIYGSIFSNNTIGGSIKENPICPYYERNCDLDISQKYDLYNLRRGYENLYKSGTEVYKDENLKDLYKGKDEKYTLIIEYNPNLQSKKLPFFQVKK